MSNIKLKRKRLMMKKWEKITPKIWRECMYIVKSNDNDDDDDPDKHICKSRIVVVWKNFRHVIFFRFCGLFKFHIHDEDGFHNESFFFLLWWDDDDEVEEEEETQKFSKESSSGYKNSDQKHQNHWWLWWWLAGLMITLPVFFLDQFLQILGKFSLKFLFYCLVAMVTLAWFHSINQFKHSIDWLIDWLKCKCWYQINSNKKMLELFWNRFSSFFFFLFLLLLFSIIIGNNFLKGDDMLSDQMIDQYLIIHVLK